MKEVVNRVHEVKHLVLNDVDYKTCLHSLVEDAPGAAVAIPCTKVTGSIKLTRTFTTEVVAMCRTLASCFDLSDVTSIALEDYWSNDAALYTFIRDHVPRMKTLRFRSDILRCYYVCSGSHGVYIDVNT